MRPARSLGIAALAVPTLAVGVALALGVGRGDSATCELEEPPDQGNGHHARPPAGFQYSSFPPTSGPSSDTPLVWDVHDEPVSQFRLVHNLLHGGVAVQYGAEVPRDAVERLRAWYEDDSDGLVVAPLPALGDRIVLTAWTKIARCETFDERSFSSFRAQNRFNGPERPPREAMRRGRGGEPNPLGLQVEPRPVRERGSLAFVFAEAATVSVHIRRGGVKGPIVRTFANISLIPATPVRLRWEARDDAGRPLPAGIYVAVAEARSPARTAVSTTSFEVR